MTVNEADFKWYYHSAKVNETKAAFQAAIANRCGMVVFIGKPACSVCAGIWGSSNLDGTGKMEKFLADNRLVGLHVEDDASHYMQLSAGMGNYVNPDGSRTTTSAPFMVFIKVKGDHLDTTSISFSGSKSDVDVFFCGSNSGYLPTMNYANVSKWLTNLMKSDAYKEACPGPETSREPELSGTLEFFGEDAEELGTTISEGVVCYNTGNAVKREATSLSETVTERYFKFQAVAGNRYVFSVTAANGGPTLAELVAKTMSLTCEVFAVEADLGPSAEAVEARTNATNGFLVLDEGFFFVPTNTGDYYLRISTTPELTSEIPFTLRYHYAKIGEPGSLGMPLWKSAEVEPGKWTMDYDAVVDWSAKNGKPFLLYFTALAWCPHCASFDHLVAETAGFKGATADLPMVAIDNRRRGEVTGPSLLYAEDYKAYGGYTAEAAETKLAVNQAIQKQLLAPGSTRITYPTFLLCQAEKTKNGNNDDVTKVRVIARANDAYSYPVDTNFNSFGETCVTKLKALAADSCEEFDNYAHNAVQAGVFELKKPAETMNGLQSENLQDGAESTSQTLLGGYDTVDWRAVEFSDKIAGTFSMEGDFDENALVTIGIYDTLGSGVNEGTLLQSVTGTGETLPTLEFRANRPSSYRVKVSVAGQTTPVKYTLAITAVDLPPYDIALDAANYLVRQCDGATAVVTATWNRMDNETDEEASVQLVLDGPGSCENAVQPIGGASSGTLAWTITGLSVEEETRVMLVSENCRVTGTNPAVIRTFAAPAFVALEGGATKTVKLIQNMKLANVAFPLVNGLDTTSTVKTLNGTLPSGVTISVQPDESRPGFASLVLAGKPSVAMTTAQRVTVQLVSGNGTLGDTLTLAFTVQPLADLNPVAANADDYTGYIISAEDGTVFGTFTLKRRSNKTFAVSAAFVDTRNPVSGTAPDWTALETGAVYTEATLAGEGVVLTLDTDGAGFGWFEDEVLGECHLAFQANMDVNTAEKEYAGNYNVSLESSHPAYQGYGWLVVEIDGEGLVTYTGKLPDGMNVVKRTTHLVEEHGNGVFTVVAFDGSDFVSGRVQITPKSQREDGEPCVSACSSSLALFWYDLESDITARLTPCGAEYDRTAITFLEQTVNHENKNFESIYFYALTLPFAEEIPASYPAGICPQLLPAGIEIVEAAEGEIPQTGGAFTIADYTNQEAQPYKDLAVAISFDAMGLMKGSFNVYDAVAGKPSKVTFQGILTPIPASCCSAGPEAVGFGSLISEDGTRSWPVRIVPDRYDGPTLVAPTVGIPTTNTVTASGAENPKLCTYVLLDKKGTIQEIANDGVFAWRDFTAPESYSVAIVANGLIGENVPLLVTAKGFSINLAKTDDITEDAPSGAIVKGWRVYGMPVEYVLTSKVPVANDLLVMAYLNGAKNLMKVTDWSQLEPGQAFWVYFNRSKKNDSQASNGLLVNEPDATIVAVDYQVPDSKGEFIFWTAPPELQPPAEFWQWNGSVFKLFEQGNEVNPGGESTPSAGWLRYSLEN